jgi:hypothetical protein
MVCTVRTAKSLGGTTEISELTLVITDSNIASNFTVGQLEREPYVEPWRGDV